MPALSLAFTMPELSLSLAFPAFLSAPLPLLHAAARALTILRTTPLSLSQTCSGLLSFALACLMDAFAMPQTLTRAFLGGSGHCRHANSNDPAHQPCCSLSFHFNFSSAVCFFLVGRPSAESIRDFNHLYACVSKKVTFH